jgi:hypothetical protein
MAARLQRDISGCTTRPISSLKQGIDLGMRLTGALMPTFTNDLAVTH